MALDVGAEPPQRDAADYDRIALSLAAGDGYPPSVVAAGGGPSAIRSPAYPGFLAATYELSGGHLRAARVAQAVLGTVTVALVGLLGALLLGGTAGLIALAIAAVYPEFVLMDSAILSETLYLPLILGAFVAALMHRRSSRPWHWAAAAGLLFGLSVLTRQSGSLVIIPLLLLVWTRPASDRRQRAVAAAALVLAAGFAVLPWTLRNAFELDAFVPVATQSGFVLAGTYNEESRHDPALPAAWRPPNAVPLYADLFRDETLSEVDLDRDLRSRALDYIADHPGYLLSVGWHNTLRLAHLGGARYEADQAGERNITEGQAEVGRFAFYALAVLAIAGAATALARRPPWYLWLAPVLLSVAMMGEGFIRLRLPVDPFLILLAACALATLSHASVPFRLRPTVLGRSRQ
jgi:4-amino-4-deoxy-L-arabinose transferase-like glycosyltransferase